MPWILFPKPQRGGLRWPRATPWDCPPQNIRGLKARPNRAVFRVDLWPAIHACGRFPGHCPYGVGDWPPEFLQDCYIAALPLWGWGLGGVVGGRCGAVRLVQGLVRPYRAEMNGGRSCGVEKFWLWGFGDLSGSAVAGAWGAGFGENRFVPGLKLSPSTPVPGSPEFRQPGATRTGNRRLYTGWLIWHWLGGTVLVVLAWLYRLGGTGLVALSWQAGHGSARALA